MAKYFILLFSIFFLNCAQATSMQDFHLQQAQEKIAKQDYAHAWGDLAYLLCQIPTHHIALQKMLEIAPNIQKQDELDKYFEKALKAAPKDEQLQSMYRDYKKAR